MKKRWKILAVVAAILIAGIYYYVSLPAINIHSSGFWAFLMVVILIILGIYALPRVRTVQDVKENRILKIGIGMFGLVVAAYGIGSLLSSPIINAKKYQQLITVEEREFNTDIQEVDFGKIPLLDKDSAALLGNRKMGSMVDMVSQFEVSNLYTQINYQDTPVRVTPLEYASPVKWLTNQKNGIPAYIMIDMATQETSLVKLDESIKYSESEYFNRNIYRHLRFHYPTYIFDSFSFEIDDEGTPYWICPVKKYNVGLFGGVTIGRVVICNAQTGEMQDYAIEDCPTWVDRVFSADLLIQLYDYYGTLKNGFLNSIFGQKGCLKTTDGYNYLALEDDVWVYTGVTSVSGDQSNVGFVLMNQRTMECRYYAVSGAEEFSAMASAEGQVQHLGYQAAFPLLINVSGEPTYFMALKDDAGLVKKYAMVNVQEYQNVAIGDTVSGCEEAYNQMLVENGIWKPDQTLQGEQITGTITKMVNAVVDGNSHVYLMLDAEDTIYDVNMGELLEIIRYEVGDEITLNYLPGENANAVISFES